jgi:hypothetical protein
MARTEPRGCSLGAEDLLARALPVADNYGHTRKNSPKRLFRQ